MNEEPTESQPAPRSGVENRNPTQLPEAESVHPSLESFVQGRPIGLPGEDMIDQEGIDQSKSGEDHETPKLGVLKSQLTRLYDYERNGNIGMVDRMLPRIAESLYPLVLKEAVYSEKDGVRQYYTGGTPALKISQGAFRKFVEDYESGAMTTTDVDGVIWAMHNNGTLAHRFIRDCADEQDAKDFLNKLSGIYR